MIEQSIARILRGEGGQGDRDGFADLKYSLCLYMCADQALRVWFTQISEGHVSRTPFR